MTTSTMTTSFTNVPLTDLRKTPWGDWKLARTQAGKSALKRLMEATQDGHTVSMRTHYDDRGRELMDAEIVHDG